VIAIVCQHENKRTNGKTKAGTTRFRCKECGKTWTESTDTLGGLRIGLDRAAQVVELLCEGNSVRATARMTGTDLDREKEIGKRWQPPKLIQ
jgi:transposase-like protein